MADHQEMIHATASQAAMYGAGAAASGATTATGGHGGGDWWSAAVSSCSAPLPETMQVFGGWSAAVVDGGNTSRSAGNTASSESPGSLATGSSITFQEPAGGGVADPAAIAVHAQTVAGGGGGGGWNQQPFLDGSGFHGYMSSSRNDHTNHHHQINTPSLMSHSSSNNSVMLQDHHHDQNYQFLSNLGFELLSSPTSPYGVGGFRSSLLRSLTEPAAAKPNNSPGFQQQQQPAMNLQPPAAAGREPLHFTNSTAPFWNLSSGFAVAAEGAGASPAQTTPASLANKRALEGVGDSSSIITKKAKADSTPLKKSRTGTPSPLPTTFKVRKEKLGDRVTALQQLVSPFGKTDTASVLHETIEYIKFLHDQVGALSAPYLKNRQQVPHLKNSGDSDGGGGGEATAASKRDLTGRGLCLVPISSTFAVASETPVDFWTPFGAAFR